MSDLDGSRLFADPCLDFKNLDPDSSVFALYTCTKKMDTKLLKIVNYFYNKPSVKFLAQILQDLLTIY